MTYFIWTNFTQWQYVVFFNVLIFVKFFTNLCARINIVAQMRENQYALILNKVFKVLTIFLKQNFFRIYHIYLSSVYCFYIIFVN